MLIRPTRYTCMIAVVCAVVLLIVDFPFSTRLAMPISRAVVEAAPLLFIGIAFLGWLAIDRPSTIDLIKQALIAAAFILWGIDLLLPAGRWTTFIGAVVIAIYVIDLAWLMEGNLRKKLRVQTFDGPEGISAPTTLRAPPRQPAPLPRANRRAR